MQAENPQLTTAADVVASKKHAVRDGDERRCEHEATALDGDGHCCEHETHSTQQRIPFGEKTPARRLAPRVYDIFLTPIPPTL